MRTFAIGDVQGCYRELKLLLARLGYVDGTDRLWFVGDLVNRGPASADVVRFVRDLGDNAVCVLGNHDLHLLAVAHGYAQPGKKDTLTEFLNAPDLTRLIDWYLQQPLYHEDASLNAVMVHAGIYPGWTLKQAALLSTEITGLLRRGQLHELFSAMYGNKPRRWRDELSGEKRRRFIINAFTRMRMIDADLSLEFSLKGPPTETTGETFKPWFEINAGQPGSRRIVFGHWSALGAGVFGNAIALDSGCVWGNKLTAVRLDSEVVEFTSVDCVQCDTV